MLSGTVVDMDMDIGNQEESTGKVKGNSPRKIKKIIPQGEGRI